VSRFCKGDKIVKTLNPAVREIPTVQAIIGQQVKVAACLSAPRFGPLDAMILACRVLVPMGINFRKTGGAYWSQSLEREMEKRVDEGYDWILTLDYDSFYRQSDVKRLCELMASHPEADAIAPLQLKRDLKTPLFTLDDGDGGWRQAVPLNEIDASGELLKARTAHFGLTLIRCSALKRMPHPWLIGVPDKSGRWGDDRIDDDANFWIKWNKIGNSLYVAHRVGVGHLAQMIVYPDQRFDPIYQTMDQFDEEGQPAGVRK